ncbi:MAG: excinuclease ABC subunit A [Deltaproteobacteria bacterium CG12_big_fil_rev_8_21_14_0_65_43_10]|nr:MAG: excinuclease ABC subunit A [Deltaproteobacteria bacterium CG2_30_43_15]PIQ45700.1 MAG: excinuclease ABC subunit A [Deltaproteobacteria bacterium CG12_big_fil_rev_8_21_14_0_65_43_10]PIU84766.1 MAG: excinuclease ABC subunit UvrA [Deltaproteobacteria bacterium CG06_land_8_20_14_3_00_44_19]PIX25349.1 MAG: excinuclease ABC subunit UvrA [Deltaproteobacteria bacterium CG_4_8_14_3_um_filter_43_13]PIZ18594.1 MAG: excinuclease ABC subunit UvrA [Deltaproteobacteria bacterium CG_4_10_14_0_8_um_filt
MVSNKIIIKGAREHNLKNIDVDIPRDKLVVITGLSGSGKSTLAFDTIYAEGQRRYVESLSAYARQFLEQMEKPDVESIEGLSPAISIEQKAISKNPRSTVATVTEIYDYLRVLFARVGKPFCYKCGKEILSQTVQQIVDQIIELPDETRVVILSPIVRGRKGEYRRELNQLRKDGYVRVKIDAEVRDLSEEIILDKNKKHHIDVIIDRLIIKGDIKKRLADSLETALNLSEGIVKVEIIGGEELTFSEKFACIDCGISYPEITPRMFSFNNPYGACPTCGGLGTTMHFDPDLVLPNPSLSLREGAILPWAGRNSSYFHQMLDALSEHYEIDIYTPFKDLSPEVQHALLYGSGEEKIKFYFELNGRKIFHHKEFEGVISNLERRYRETDSDFIREELERYMNNNPCPACHGNRLRQESLFVKVDGRSICDITNLSIKEAFKLFYNIRLSDRDMEIAARILKEIRERLGFLINVGVDYLTLDRSSATLSGGEGQRIRLATQIGSSLVGVLYILDEPSIGLHQRDNIRLLEALKRLRDIGNTVLVVEHDEETILSSDYIVDMGPGAGVDGGNVVFCGTPQEIVKDENSLTGKYLSRKLTIPVPIKRRRPDKRYFVVKGASENNLKNISVKIPLGLFNCVTGVSGSGKSTLVIDTICRVLAQKLYHTRERAGKVTGVEGLEYIDKVIDIDQSPIGRTPRSNPATYTGVFTHIRDIFSKLPESRARGYRPGRYSFNVRGGRCEACRGDGTIKIEMHFLPDVYVMCEVCKGRRYNRETLEIQYKGKNIADILDMTVDQAFAFLNRIPKIKAKLQTLSDVGLNYIKLGQSATTLSGGEAQRVRLAKELSKRSTGKTLYILDEPTTGLHFADIQKLLHVLNKLIDAGNTVIVIEHNLDVIKTADFIIDLGPEGGEKGGEVVACGTPEELTGIRESYTGQFLKKVIN